MNDASGALVWIDGPGTYGYAVVSADGQVFNWGSGAWEAMPPAPLAAHIRKMATVKFGPANWSQDVAPAIVPRDSFLLAMIFTLGSTGLPSGFRESVDLTSKEATTQATLTLYASGR